MTPDELDERLAQLDQLAFELGAQRFAYRELMARVIGQVAIREAHPNAYLQELLEAIDQRIDGLRTETEATVEAVTLMRAEVDWVVTSARALVERAKK